jgi:minor extracellular serine protease Vpr
VRPSIPKFLGCMALGAAISLPVSFSEASTTVDVSRLVVRGGHKIGRIDPALKKASGSVDVVVQLKGMPLATANGENSHRAGGRLSHPQQVAHSQAIRKSQDDVLATITGLGGKKLASVRVAYNAVIVRIDASKVTELAAHPDVAGISPVRNSRLALSDTVPYIGAAAAQQVGLDGSGVKVAVVDSGVDYTHRNLGGTGTVAAYEAAFGTSRDDPRNTTLDGLFPTAKVVGGFDFVGDAFEGLSASDPLAPDPDPIDFAGASAPGHGTHVADIIAGRSTDGQHVGVAPGASLYAVKACSSNSGVCSGIAVLQAFDFALDPNGDGSMDDAVDIINFSDGHVYGQREDSWSTAAENVVRAGVVVVAAAGNGSDKPYVLIAPSDSPGVISVANTRMPRAFVIPLQVNAPANIADTYGNVVLMDWAPIGDDAVTGEVVVAGRACVVSQGDVLPPVAGKIALVDRSSACPQAEKVRAASDAGAIGVLIGLIAPGDAILFANPGQCPEIPNGTCKPALSIQQSLANAIKENSAAPVHATISRTNAISLAGNLAPTTARGPSNDRNLLKPDIGAPGSSVSATVGTGSGESSFSGTSGATPMIVGAAALLLQAHPERAPWEIKSLLMNTADANVFTNVVTRPGELAPITRIGAGEVRVDRALASTTAAWSTDERAGSLSFGYLNTSELTTLRRRVELRNYSPETRTYSISNEFRDARHEASGAVKLGFPATVVVRGNFRATFDVVMKIDPRKLPTWTANGGPDGGNGDLLTAVEFAGLIKVRDEIDDIHLAWQVLPHKSAEVRAQNTSVVIGDQPASLLLQNHGQAKDGDFDVFALTGTSPRIPREQLPPDGSDRTVTDIAAVGARLVDGESLQFAVNTYERRAHPAWPAEFNVLIDRDLDGNPDFRVFTRENGDVENFGAGVSGQTAVFVANLATGDSEAFFFADADFNSGNMIMTVPLQALGLAPDHQFEFDVVAVDNYFTGRVTDTVADMRFTPATPKFTTDVITGTVPAGGHAVTSVDNEPAGNIASPSQIGLLLLYRDASREAETIAVSLGGSGS